MRKILKIFTAGVIAIGLGYIASVLFVGNIMPTGWFVEIKDSKTEHFSNGRIRYSEVGNGPEALLFLHGFNGSLTNWKRVIARLDQCGHAISIDIPGFGGSEWDTNTYDLTSQARRIQKFLARRGIQKVTLIGTSMGASLSAQFAAQYPEMVHGLVLLAPSGYPGSLRYFPPVSGFLRRGNVNPVATSIAKTALYKMLFPDSVALQSLTLVTSYSAAWVDALEKIKAPTILFWSLGDDRVPYSFASKVAGKIENHKVMTLPERVGHNIPGEAPAAIAKAACSLVSIENIPAQQQLTPEKS